MAEEPEKTRLRRGEPDSGDPATAAGAPGPWKKTKVIGKPLPRVDAYERVSGSAVYPSDVRLPNMLYGAILRSPHPHARVETCRHERRKRCPGSGP